MIRISLYSCWTFEVTLRAPLDHPLGVLVEQTKAWLKHKMWLAKVVTHDFLIARITFQYIMYHIIIVWYILIAWSLNRNLIKNPIVPWVAWGVRLYQAMIIWYNSTWSDYTIYRHLAPGRWLCVELAEPHRSFDKAAGSFQFVKILLDWWWLCITAFNSCWFGIAYWTTPAVFL